MNAVQLCELLHTSCVSITESSGEQGLATPKAFAAQLCYSLLKGGLVSYIDPSAAKTLLIACWTASLWSMIDSIFPGWYDSNCLLIVLWLIFFIFKSVSSNDTTD